MVRFDTNRALTLRLTPQPHQREFRTNSFSTPGGGTNEDVVVSSVQRLEYLCLDLVKRLDCGRIDGFELLVVEGGNRKVLEVEESGRWRELLGEYEMLEGNGDAGFRVQPSVRDDGNEVVGWNRLEHWNSDCDVMFHFGVLLPKNECITKENDFTIDIFDENGERFGASVNLLVPTEVRDNGKVDAKEGTCDGLDRGLQPEQGSAWSCGYGRLSNSLQLREVMHQTVHQSAGVLEVEKFSYLLWRLQRKLAEDSTPSISLTRSK